MSNVSIDGGNDWGNLGRVCGGNAAEGKGESHGGGRATRIKQGGAGDVTTGMGGTFGPTRQNGDGNEPATGEKHGNMAAFRDGGKVSGSEFVDHYNGRGGAKHTLIPDHIQVDDRGKDTSGNEDGGGREKQGQKKAEYVKASQRGF